MDRKSKDEVGLWIVAVLDRQHGGISFGEVYEETYPWLLNLDPAI
jgi:hypothetical protein